KCEGNQPAEIRKFSVDPQITSFEVLQSILAKAFDLKGDFAICYRAYDVTGQEIYMRLISDWDLDAAFLKAHNTSVATNQEPCLCLRVDLKPFEEQIEDWQQKQNVGKTLNMVQKVLNFGDDMNSSVQPSIPALSDGEFRKFCDAVGQIVHAKELRSVIYYGGIEPSLRKVVWKHLLNVYPEGMSGRERMDYIKKKAAEYEKLKSTWKQAIAQVGKVYAPVHSYTVNRTQQVKINNLVGEMGAVECGVPQGSPGPLLFLIYLNNLTRILPEMDCSVICYAHDTGPVAGELAYTTGMVRKDVLRTDRHHPFYAGSDDNQNIHSLFNILTTYALNHPKVSYCQGMSDLASPLLVTMNDEAHAYICFCALMQRLVTNFMIDGIAMTQKFTHLAEGLMYYDPEFYNYLKVHQADDLLFCYRWLLLEMKREFAFGDSLRMLEVLWASLPADHPQLELKLFDIPFQHIPPSATPPISPLVLKMPRWPSVLVNACISRS
ncbi:hypothetical protein D910_01468, partial [Dendroctonus ponderosae]